MKKTKIVKATEKEDKTIISVSKKTNVKDSSKSKKEEKKALQMMMKIVDQQNQSKKLRIYKEPNITEEETVINVLYWKEVISIYTTNVELQKQLLRILGNPTKEDVRGRSIVASRWDIPMSEKNKISQVLLKANILGL